MTDVKLYKLNSGEEILASIKEEAADKIVVEDAVVLVYRQLGEGQMSAGFAPYMPYGDGPITIYKSSIAGFADVKSNLLEEYNRIFSKIQIAPAGILKGL